MAPSAYYAWHRQRNWAVPEPTWQVAVREAFAHHGQRYGTRRLRAELWAMRSAAARAKSSEVRLRVARKLALEGRSAAPC